MQGVLFVHALGKYLLRMAFADLSTDKMPSLCSKVTDLCVARPVRQGGGVTPGGVVATHAGAVRGQGDIFVRESLHGDRVVPREGQGAVPVLDRAALLAGARG